MPDPIPPIAKRHELPTVPYRRTDIPRGALYVVGVLTWSTTTNYKSPGRPVVSVAVWCERCRRTHFHPWRADWGTAADAVVPVVPRCQRPPARPVWVGLSPTHAEHNARVHAEARAAYEAWLPIAGELLAAGKAARAAERAQREAEAAALEASRPKPKPLQPLWGPPVAAAATDDEPFLPPAERLTR